MFYGKRKPAAQDMSRQGIAAFLRADGTEEFPHDTFGSGVLAMSGLKRLWDE